MFEKATSWRRYAFVGISAVFLVAYLLLSFTPHAPGKMKPYARQKNIRYILQWNEPDWAPLSFMGHGSTAFIENGCEYTNCYVTSDRDYFADVSEFDAIVFNGRTIEKLEMKDLPLTRSATQKYVYANMESSHNYPVCSSHYKNYFNWTWTYKLNSDSRWGYFTVYNLTNSVVAPKVNMHWPELVPFDNELKRPLGSKRIAAAWFVSNCQSLSKREFFAVSVVQELEKYGLSLHVYGDCGQYTCKRADFEACSEVLTRDYYFYFAFENSFAEDYVTEKVLTALYNYAIPVVYGAANYSRFLPPGSYLNARELGAEQLAARMASIIKSHRSNDPTQYYDFFRWRNHYTFGLTFENDDVCNQCKMLNDQQLMSKKTVYSDFTAWWNSEFATCDRKPMIKKYET